MWQFFMEKVSGQLNRFYCKGVTFRISMTRSNSLWLGGNFCGGYDLSELSSMDQSSTPRWINKENLDKGRGPMVSYITSNLVLLYRW